MKRAIVGENATVFLEGKPIMKLGTISATVTLHPRESVVSKERLERWFPSGVKNENILLSFMQRSR